MIDDKILKSQCQNLLNEFDEVIKYVIELEDSNQSTTINIKDPIEEIGKAAVYKAGIKEGMRKIYARINDIAQK